MTKRRYGSITGPRTEREIDESRLTERKICNRIQSGTMSVRFAMKLLDLATIEDVADMMVRNGYEAMDI